MRAARRTANREHVDLVRDALGIERSRPFDALDCLLELVVIVRVRNRRGPFVAERGELAAEVMRGVLDDGVDALRDLGPHLRELGKDVDVSPRHNLGGLKTDSMDAIGQARRPVTSGDIERMFASA